MAMCQIQLTKEEKDNLRKIQRKTKDKRIYRKVSVLLGLNEGYSIEQLSKILGIDEIIYFADGVHPQHNTQVSNAWIYKGEEKQIKSNTGRSRININGVINPNIPTDIIVGEYKTINADTTIEFFQDIERKNPKKKKIIIYADNARYYKNKKVKEYLKTSKIRLIFLPPYSPNLNLIERLWKFMKKIVINNKYYEKSTEFRRKLLDFFDNIQIYKNELDSLITNNFQIIGIQ